MSALFEQLDRCGYLVLENFFPDSLRHALIDRVEGLYASEGEAAGSEFRGEPGTRMPASGPVAAPIVIAP